MSDLHRAFLSALENYPSQDNEGYHPDRAGFKCGFYSGYRYAETENAKLKAEYDDKFKAMQAEIDKRDYLLKLALEDFENLRLGVVEENDSEINHTIALIKKELNQRGEGENLQGV